MTLSFKQKFDNGEPTYFVDSIWNCLCGGDFTMTLSVQGYLKRYEELFPDKAIDTPFEIKKKLHTIRFLTDKMYKRWCKWAKEKKQIHFVINNRTPQRFQFAPLVPVVSIQKLHITHFDEPEDYNVWVSIDDKVQGAHAVAKLALNDGFDSSIHFFDYFTEKAINTYAKQGRHPYIIHWTDLKY